MKEIRQAAVIGAGLMGHGIALTLARHGWHTRVSDPSDSVRASLPGRVAEGLATLGLDAEETAGILERIEAGPSVADTVRDAAVVFEAVPERLPLKRSVFAELEAHAPEDALLASNTSVIPITRITEGLATRHRALGTHWWNPPHVIPLVEVVRTEWTDADCMAAMMELLGDLGKTPVAVERDVPGFIGNRLQHALWREAIHLVESGVCTAEDVDRVVKSSFGRRLAVLGPLENADLVGTNLTLDIHDNLLFDLDRRPRPSPYLRQLVAEGRLGMSTGQGFRSWSRDEAKATWRRLGRHLQALEPILQD